MRGCNQSAKMNKVTTLWFQKTLNSLRSCMPPSRTCLLMEYEGVWWPKCWTVDQNKVCRKWPFHFSKGSRQWLFLLPLVFPRYYIFFMSGIAIIALLLLVTSLAKVSRASPYSSVSESTLEETYCRLWSPVNDVASFWEQFNCQLTLMHSLKLRRDCHLE